MQHCGICEACKRCETNAKLSDYAHAYASDCVDRTESVLYSSVCSDLFEISYEADLAADSLYAKSFAMCESAVKLEPSDELPF